MVSYLYVVDLLDKYLDRRIHMAVKRRVPLRPIPRRLARTSLNIVQVWKIKLLKIHFYLSGWTDKPIQDDEMSRKPLFSWYYQWYNVVQFHEYKKTSDNTATLWRFIFCLIFKLLDVVVNCKFLLPSDLQFRPRKT